MKSSANRLPTSYPQSVPYSPPASLQARVTRLRRWLVVLILTTSTVFVGAVAGFVYMTNRAAAAASATVPPPEQVGVLLSASVPAASPALAKDPPATVDPKKRDRLLEAVGGLSAVHLYQTYLNIGLVADAVEKEAYTKAEATKILQTVGELVTMVEKQLARLPPTGLDADDQESLERIRVVTGDLRLQAGALLGYWATGDMEQVARYHKARERTWEGLQDVLGIEE